MTFEQLSLFVAVILALIGAYNAVCAARKNRREEKRLREGPTVRLAERVDRHDELISGNGRRLDDLEGHIEKIDRQSTIMLRGVRALLSHEVNGNSADRLKSSLAEIDDYLIERK